LVYGGGVDVAVVVNLRARHGSRRVVGAFAELLPRARLLVSRSLDEALKIAEGLVAKPPALLVSAGGDGTAISLLNATRTPPNRDGLLLDGGAFALLPLGTGNGWAHVTGAPSWREGVARLGRLAERDAPIPATQQDLLEVEGTLAPFAGTGWDAEIIEDFHAQKTGFGVLPRWARTGLTGYLQGLFTRTIPRNLVQDLVDVEVRNTGEPAFTVDDRGAVVPVEDGARGALLYRGPASVCGAATTAEWGFGFRAFPFAGAMPGRFCLRVYAGGAVEATLRMAQLWRGKHPLPRMHTWLLTSCEARFSRPVPFQIGGDRLGMRDRMTYSVAPARVRVLDWQKI